jgi:protein FAM50
MESSESNANSRFIAPQPTAEDRLKEQTIGLVQLSDFRKRRAEAVEQSGRGSGPASGASSPRDG